MNIKISGSITILKDSKTVFDFISNLEHDKLWRKEVNYTNVSGGSILNSIATEDSFLSKRVPSHILNLQCIELVENKLVAYQTLPDSKFFLKSIRKVESVSQNETRVLYSIEFDKGIVKHGLGFALPDFIINLAAKADMKKYLSKLKSIMEISIA